MIDLQNGRVQSIDLIETLSNGSRRFHVRGKFGGPGGAPVALSMFAGLVGLATGAAATAGSGGHEQEQRFEELAAEVTASAGYAMISGIASSTGVDSYGTEMTLNALESMRAQFSRPHAVRARRGVAYAPTHWEREWSEIIGRTVGARIVEQSVANPANPEETSYVLWVDTEIDLSKARGEDLAGALRDRQEIGQSIGGWFTSVFFVQNAQGEIERVLIDDVDLDHLAATRTPSNGDSDDLELIRASIGEAIRSQFPAQPVPLGTQLGRIDNPAAYAAALRSGDIAPTGLSSVAVALLADVVETRAGDPQLRHVLAVEADGGTFRVDFAKGGSSDRADEPGSLAIPKRANVRHITQIEETEETVSIWFERPEGDEEAALSAPAPEGRSPEEPAQAAAPEADPAPERAGEQPDPDEASAASVHSEADRAEDPHDTEEFDMNAEQMAQLAALIGAAVGERVDASLEAHLASSDAAARTASEQDPATAPAPVEVAQERAPTPTPPAPVEASSPVDDELAQLRAFREQAEIRAQMDADLIDRLTHQSVRATQGRHDRVGVELHEEMALEAGDIEPLLNRAKAEGVMAVTVRTVEKDRSIQRILSAGTERDLDVTERIRTKDLRGALRAAFRAYHADGGFQPARSSWRR